VSGLDGREPVRAQRHGGRVAVRRFGQDGGQLPGQLVESGPVRGLLGQTVLQQPPQRPADALQHGFVVHHPVRRQIRAVRVEGAAPGDGVHQQRPEGEDVRRRADRAGVDELFGGHEGRCADHLAGLGQRLVVLRRAGDAEVDDARAVFGQQDVGRLQVPVHHPCPVDVAQGLHQAQRQPAQFGVRQGAPVADPPREGGPGHVLGGHPGPGRLGVRVQDRCREGSADLADGRDLLPEPGPEDGVRGVLGVDDLDGHVTARARSGPVDDAHAPGPEPVEQPVAADRLRVLTVQRHARIPFPRSGVRDPQDTERPGTGPGGSVPGRRGQSVTRRRAPAPPRPSAGP
jgi:hypothetical protein